MCEDMCIIMMTKGAKISAEEAQAFVTEVDFDHDGYIYYSEVVDYLISAMEAQ